MYKPSYAFLVRLKRISASFLSVGSVCLSGWYSLLCLRYALLISSGLAWSNRIYRHKRKYVIILSWLHHVCKFYERN